MTRDEKIRKIGSYEAYLAVGIALLIDLILFIFSFWGTPILCPTFENTVRPVVAICIFVGTGQLFGKWCAVAIIARRWLSGLTGGLCALLTLAVTIVISGVVIQVIDFILIPNQAFNPSEIVPVLWIMMVYSCIPVFIHGVIFGKRIQNKGKKLHENH